MHNFSDNDPRNKTVASRMEIGFPPDKQTWATAPAIFSDNKLEISGHPVMESWELPYMRELAEIATRNGGTVLELGFGIGLSAGLVQRAASVDRHIIIEANEGVYERLLEFADRHPSVEPVPAFWEDAIDEIEDDSIDGILFDTYPLDVSEIHGNHFAFVKHAYRILRPGGIFTYYSDEIDTLSSAHVDVLYEAGFSEVSWDVVDVSPPKDCDYWSSPTIVAPIVTK